LQFGKIFIEGDLVLLFVVCVIALADGLGEVGLTPSSNYGHSEKKKK